MKRSFFVLFFIISSLLGQAAQIKSYQLRDLINKIKESKHGAKIIRLAAKRAEKQGSTLEGVIQLSHHSKMDIRYLRRIAQKRKVEIEYEKEYAVYLNKNLPYKVAILDLAHELTHFVMKEETNPYSKKFEAKTYIKESIEGVGGEVDAFMSECLIAKELGLYNSKTQPYCEIAFKDKRNARKNLINHYYRMGNYYHDFIQELGPLNSHADFKQLSPKSISFTAATWQMPYPMAMLNQYRNLKKKVCQNNRRLQERRIASLDLELRGCH